MQRPGCSVAVLATTSNDAAFLAPVATSDGNTVDVILPDGVTMATGHVRDVGDGAKAEENRRRSVVIPRGRPAAAWSRHSSSGRWPTSTPSSGPPQRRLREHFGQGEEGLERETGFEPATSALEGPRSTN